MKNSYPSLFELTEDEFSPQQIEKIKALIAEQIQLGLVSSLRLDVLHVEPEKKRTGLIAYADGTDWDPGKGEGLYFYGPGGTWFGTF